MDRTGDVVYKETKEGKFIERYPCGRRMIEC